jgi:hypothetical protein
MGPFEWLMKIRDKVRTTTRTCYCVITMQLCDARCPHYYYPEANAVQSAEGAMKILFLVTAACLVLSLSSSAQAQGSSSSPAQGKKSLMINFAFRTAQITAQLQETLASLTAFRNVCRCVASWAISGISRMPSPLRPIECRLWVISGHLNPGQNRLLSALVQKRTNEEATRLSAKCQ